MIIEQRKLHVACNQGVIFLYAPSCHLCSRMSILNVHLDKITPTVSVFTMIYNNTRDPVFLETNSVFDRDVHVINACIIVNVPRKMRFAHVSRVFYKVHFRNHKSKIYLVNITQKI